MNFGRFFMGLAMAALLGYVVIWVFIPYIQEHQPQQEKINVNPKQIDNVVLYVAGDS